MRIDEAIRRDIFDALQVERINWSGRLEEPEFLARVFDLQRLPSTDHRFQDAYRDIWQHRVLNPNDWNDDWIFYDSRFNLLRCEDETFLSFLCETIHPVVCPDPGSAERLRQLYNRLLQPSGYELVERAQMGGRPVFSARRAELS